MTRRGFFGSHTRAADGLIATFELPDGSVHVERFAQVVRTTGGYARIVTKDGPPAVEQVAARADELDARVLSLSSPETIMTDLQGARVALRTTNPDDRLPDGAVFPEIRMLARIGRADLFRAPARRQIAEPSSHRRKRR